MNNFHHFHSIICSSDRLHIKKPNKSINRQHTTLILYLTIHSPHIPPYPYQGTIKVQTVEYQKSKKTSDKQKLIAEKGYMLHGITVCDQEWCSTDIARVSTSRQRMRKSPGLQRCKGKKQKMKILAPMTSSHLQRSNSHSQKYKYKLFF